jgi:hypothetical protein
MVTGIRRLFDRVVSAMSGAMVAPRRPRRVVDGLELLLLDRQRWPQAEHVFNRAVSALHEIATRAPEAYAALRRDVVHILFVPDDCGLRYHPLQLAVAVPPYVALEADARRYAAWLVGAIAPPGRGTPREFLEALLGAHPPEDRAAIREWLAGVEERTRDAGTLSRPPNAREWPWDGRADADPRRW